MRKVATSRFGEMEIAEQDIVKFAHGIPAFEEEHEFMIIPHGEGSPYMFLQSLQTPELAFLMTDPFVFFSDYTFELDDENVAELGLEDMQDIMVCTLISIPPTGIADMTTNLLAPVVINQHTLQAKQVVLSDVQYTTKHRLFPKKKEEK